MRPATASSSSPGGILQAQPPPWAYCVSLTASATAAVTVDAPSPFIAASADRRLAGTRWDHRCRVVAMIADNAAPYASLGPYQPARSPPANRSPQALAVALGQRVAEDRNDDAYGHEFNIRRCRATGGPNHVAMIRPDIRPQSVQNGRNSRTPPSLAIGCFEAISTASSRSAHSSTSKPATRSLVSTYGPSVSRTLLSRTRTVVESRS